MKLTERISDPVFNFYGKAWNPLIGPSTELGGTSNQSIEHVVIPPGQSFPTHYHKLAEETYYILRGKALMRVDGQQFALGVGQAMLMMPGEIHDLACSGDEDLELIAISAPPYDPQDVYLPE